MEIERKYVLSELPAELRSAPRYEISQGYIAVDANAEVRVRRIDDRRLLTVKGAGGLTRIEEEFEIGADQFATLWPLTSGRRVEKTRHVLSHGDRVVEVDVFKGDLAGLIVAEVEFPDEATAVGFAAPAWFGADVTFDPRYKNAQLARLGRPG